MITINGIVVEEESDTIEEHRNAGWQMRAPRKAKRAPRKAMFRVGYRNRVQYAYMTEEQAEVMYNDTTNDVTFIEHLVHMGVRS